MRFCLASYRRWAARPIVATVAPDRSRPRHRLALDRGPATLRRLHDQSQQPNRCGEHSRVISRLRTRSASPRKSADAGYGEAAWGAPRPRKRRTAAAPRPWSSQGQPADRSRASCFIWRAGSPRSLSRWCGDLALASTPHFPGGASTTEQRHRWQSTPRERRRAAGRGTGRQGRRLPGAAWSPCLRPRLDCADNRPPAGRRSRVR